MALDRHQQLVLDMRQPGGTRLVLAPPLEPSQARAERQHMLEVRTIGLIQNDLPQLSRLGATYQRGPAR
jgi:hypothetical protein